MSIQTKTPLAVTTVSSVASGDYIDLTLSNGTRAKITKSTLFSLMKSSFLLGLSESEALALYSDLNDFKVPFGVGQFRNQLNKPESTSVYCVLSFQITSSNFFVQIAIGSGGDLFKRTYAGASGNWSVWKQFG